MILLLPWMMSWVIAAEPVDQTKPASVVSAVFDAARTKDASAMHDLCMPNGQGDGDTRTLCAMTPEHAQWEEFVMVFKDGKVQETTVNGDVARVAFLFGPGATKPETMVLGQVDKKWYLVSF